MGDFWWVYKWGRGKVGSVLCSEENIAAASKREGAVKRTSMN